MRGELFTKLLPDRDNPGVRPLLVALASQVAAGGKAADPAALGVGIDGLPDADRAFTGELVRAVAGMLTPADRATATETLLARPAWAPALLDAIEAGTVRPADVAPARVQVLLAAAGPAARPRAAKLLAGAGPAKRADVLARYRKALELTGDPARGKAVFAAQCSACHRLEGVGTAVGPDLSAAKDRGAETVLTNVLDPNREVLPQFYTYLLTTDDDAVLTGLIAAETANTVTVRKADGRTETVQRANVRSLRSTGLSAMPEGLEAGIPVPAMADLLAYLASIR